MFRQDEIRFTGSNAQPADIFTILLPVDEEAARVLDVDFPIESFRM